MNKIRMTAIAAAALVTGVLAGCSSVPRNVVVVAPPPPQTPAVLAVKHQPVPGAVAGADGVVPDYEHIFASWRVCRPGTLVWEQPEDDIVMFSCRQRGPGSFIFRWKVEGTAAPRLQSVTHISQDDVEYAGIQFNGADARAILEDVFADRVPQD